MHIEKFTIKIKSLACKKLQETLKIFMALFRGTNSFHKDFKTF